MGCIVIYDIVEDKIRNKIADVCLDFGLRRIQYSAFLGELTHNQKGTLKKMADDMLLLTVGDEKQYFHGGRMELKEIGEFGLIDRVASRLKNTKSVVKGIGDDTAVLQYTRDKFLLFTTDMLVEDVHFRLSSGPGGRDTSGLSRAGEGRMPRTMSPATPAQVGHKAIGVNVSDIAAMGGVPRWAVVSIGIRKGVDVGFVDRLYAGMDKVCKRFGLEIVGGDTNRSDKVVISVSLIGEVEKDNLVLRSGAKPDDVIFVTGTLGGSIYGKHLCFTPRLKEARLLVQNVKVNSMIDISDGLSSDLNQIAKASNVGAILLADKIPVSKKTYNLRNALHDGEDFELLFTLSPREAKTFTEKFRNRMRVPVTEIGMIVEGFCNISLAYPDGHSEVLKREGYNHFRGT
jgi:thiamine-monophosphate kinase